MKAGVIVAGGQSTRFEGADKAVAPIGGTPMVRHVADRLGSAVDALVVNCRSPQADAVRDAMAGYPHPVTLAIDMVEGLGPVGGIATGLEVLDDRSTPAFVAACDMPLLESAFVGHLFDVAEAEGADAVVPRDGDGWYQVLHAVYEPESMATACRRALDDGEHKLLAPLKHLDVVVVDPEDYAGRGSHRSFENVNTREDLRRLQADLDR